MKEYVRVTFITNGGLTKRTVWARKGKVDEKRGLASYWAVDREGQDTEPRELIIGTIGEMVEKPATMNLFYGELEVCK